MSECERGLARPWSSGPYRIKLTFERAIAVCGLRLAGAERGGGGSCFVGLGGGYI